MPGAKRDHTPETIETKGIDDFRRPIGSHEIIQICRYSSTGLDSFVALGSRTPELRPHPLIFNRLQTLDALSNPTRLSDLMTRARQDCHPACAPSLSPNKMLEKPSWLFCQFRRSANVIEPQTDKV
jgi:hypothetical protein